MFPLCKLDNKSPEFIAPANIECYLNFVVTSPLGTSIKEETFMGIFRDLIDKFVEPVEDTDIEDGIYETRISDIDEGSFDEYEYDDVPEEQFYRSYEEEPYRASTFVQESQPMTTPVAKQQQAVVVMLTPYDIRTSQIVCDHIKEGHIVICNLMSSANNQRVVDYISGGVYALEGKIEPTPVKTTFVCTPKSVELVVESNEAASGTKVSAL